MPLHPQVTLLLDQLASAGGAPLEEQEPIAAREMYANMTALSGTPQDVASIEDRTLEGNGGDIPIRIYTPVGEPSGGRVGAIVFFHGGGFVIGNIDSHDPIARELANLSGAVVISVDYRLAPEHRAPAAAEDCYAATKWVADNADALGIDPSRIAVAGDSAGGNLAAVTALLARDRGGPALAFQALIYPVTDLTQTQPSMVENGKDYMLTAAGLTWFYGHYLGEDGDPKDPIVTPLLADNVAGLPPALVITAEFDPLRDEGEAYAARLSDAGVATTVSRYDGMIHGFAQMGLVLTAGQDAIAEVAAAIKSALA